VTRPLTPGEVAQLAESLLRPSALAEAGVLIGCLSLAWLVVRLLRGREPIPGSVWFGDRVVDGVLFPVLALLTAFAASRLLASVLPIAVFKLAVPILLSLVVIRLTVRVLSAAFPKNKMVRAIERTVSWLAWIGVVLWVTGLLPLVMDELDQIRWKIGASQLSLRNIVEGGLAAVVVMIIALWLSSAIEGALLKGAADNLSLRKIAANTVRAVLILVGLLLALSAAGIDLTALSVLGGAIGVGIGLGLQKLASNYVSGFVILAERSLRIGDTVRVDNFEGRITDINTRYTVIRAGNGRESIVPNEMLITQRVENASLTDSDLLLSTVVQVAYGTDLQTVFPALISAIQSVPRVLSTPAPAVQLSNFSADGLELTLLYWIGDPENGAGSARSAVNLAVLDCLQRLSIEIPYPQRVVHHYQHAAAGGVVLPDDHQGADSSRV
jgi:small-conductance mechanosensitive channel